MLGLVRGNATSTLIFSFYGIELKLLLHSDYEVGKRIVRVLEIDSVVFRGRKIGPIRLIGPIDL